MSFKKVHSLVVLALLAGTVLGVSDFAVAHQRGGGRQGGGGAGRAPSGGGRTPQVRQTRSNPVRSNPVRSNPVRSNPTPVHARRETVRTPNFVQRSNGFFPQTPPTARIAPTRRIPSGPANLSVSGHHGGAGIPSALTQRRFTKTTQGRVYDNGLVLRRGIKVTATWQRHFFPRGHFHFPHYRQTFVRGACYVSPFAYFFGVCVPYIDTSDCHVFPPSVAFVDLPVYNGPDCTGFADSDSQNYLNDPNLDQDAPGLGNAIDELTETFQGGNVDGLVTLIDPNTQIAIYLRGHYRYSIPANDFVDLSRDEIQSGKTVQFSPRYLHERSPDVFSVGGTQTYRATNEEVETVWVSYVLQDIGGQWTLTQVGTSPGHIQKLTS